MQQYRLSRALYRLLIRAYPLEFRCHFRSDLEADFIDLLSTRGRRAAWMLVVQDWLGSVSATRTYARQKRRRLWAIAYRGDTRMSSIAFDLPQALRGLTKAPVFSLVTIATLALGIGANSAIFSLVNAVLLRPLGYERPERLMLVHETIPESNVPRFGVSPADYVDMLQYETSFSSMAAYRTRRFELSGGGASEQVTVAQATAPLFQLLGVSPAVGRTFTAADEQNPQVAVISHGLWQRRLGGAEVLGATLMLDRQPYTVIGVMPASFQFPRRGAEFNNVPADAWLPLVFNPFERNARGMFFNHSVIGRLRDEVTAERAAADFAALGPRIRENYPAVIRNSPFSLIVTATSFTDEIAGQVRRPLLVLLGAVGLVLLVACANVANLILGRAVAREREVAVRAALGAAGHRLTQLMLLEGLVLALFGGALGLLIGQWALRLIPAVLTTSLPGVMDVVLDVRVVGFTFALSLLTALAFSVIPLAGGMRRDVNALLRDARSAGGRRQHRFQAALVVSSVGLAFVLLVGAGLLIQSFTRLTAQDTGLRPGHVVTARVTLPPAGYSEPAPFRAFYHTVQQQLAAIPGALSAAIATDLPIRGDGERRAFTPDRHGDTGGLPPSIAVTWVHGDYFATFGIPIVRGRPFTAEEQAQDRGAVIVSAAMASRFWPGEEPIGKRIKWGIAASQAPWYTIVGVAGDVIDGPLGDEPVIHAYVPFSEMPDRALAAPISGLFRNLNVAVRSDIDAGSLLSSVREVIRSADPALALFEVATLAEILSEASAPQRFSATVLSGFAAGGLLLAAIGLYGVLAFSVGQRTREIGVRLALGADPSGVVGMVLRQGMALVVWGIVIGTAGAVAATRLMTSLLFETAAYDAGTYLTVPLVLVLVSLIACYLPARRAASTSPMTALRID
ncbi:MAG TPA: ABC transporter permease [Vicinamibacterales bacterium]|nr:ABC transporter permease [Vicinamibacterales bacterium]